MRKILALIAFLFFLLFPFTAEAAYLDLVWDPNTEPDLAGYRIYYGTASGQYSKSDPASIQPTFIARAAGKESESRTFQLTVTDNGGLQAADECTITVSDLVYGPDLTGSWVNLKGFWRRRKCWIRGAFDVQNMSMQKASSSLLRFYLSPNTTFDESEARRNTYLSSYS